VGHLKSAIQACDGSSQQRCARLSGFAVEIHEPAILCFRAREAHRERLLIASQDVHRKTTTFRDDVLGVRRLIDTNQNERRLE
jgi:hypothetical protein